MRWLQLGLLGLAIMAGSFSRASFTALQEPLRLALGLTDNQLAVLQGPAFAFFMLLVAAPLGLAIDRHSRARLTLGLVVLLAVGALLTAMAGDFRMLLVARSIVGFGVLAILPAAYSMAAELYPPEQRGRASMVMLMCGFGGSSIGFALGGYLAGISDWGPDAWRWAMYWVAAVLVLAGACIAALRDPQRTARAAAGRTVRQSLGEFWSYRRLLTILLTGKIMALIALQSSMSWAAPTFSRVFSLTPAQVGGVAAVAIPLGGILGTLAGGFLSDLCQRRGGPRLTTRAIGGVALLALPMTFFPAVPSATLAGAMLASMVGLLTTLSVMVSTVVAVVVPNRIRGFSMGVLIGVGAFIPLGVGPILVSGISGALGGTAMIGKALNIVCAGGCVACAVIFAAGSRLFRDAAND